MSYSQVEQLLKRAAMLEPLKANLEAEIKDFCLRSASDDDKDEILFSMLIGNRFIDEIPKTANPDPGAKLTNILQNYPKWIGGANKEAFREILEELNMVGIVCEQLQAGLRCLSDAESTVISQFYLQGRFWKEIACKLDIPVERAAHYRRSGIEKLVKILRIKPEHYEFVMARI